MKVQVEPREALLGADSWFEEAQPRVDDVCCDGEKRREEDAGALRSRPAPSGALAGQERDEAARRCRRKDQA